MLRRLLSISLLCLTGWISNSSAAPLDICDITEGCGPDFSFSPTGSYVASTGLFTLNASGGNVTFLPGTLDSDFEALPGSATLFIQNGNFNMSFTVDGDGNLIAGSNDITLSGRIFKGTSGTPTAISHNGTLLDGNIITGGSIDGIHWSGNNLLFYGSINSSSLITTAGYGNGLSGLLGSMSMIDSNGNSLATVDWSQDWTLSSATLNVVVPIPAAAWLFGSGLLALLGVARTKRNNA